MNRRLLVASLASGLLGVGLPGAAAPAAAGPSAGATTTRVSVSSSGRPAGNGPSTSPEVSDDGRIVVFDTRGALDPADTNRAADVYVHDRATLRTTRVSLGLDGGQLPTGEGGWHPTMSGDGRTVAFTIGRPAPPNPRSTTFRETVVRDLRTGAESIASVHPDGTAGGDCVPLALSDDGRFLLFRDFREMVDAPARVFVRDRLARITVEVDPNAQRLSGDGGTVLITTAAALTPSDVDGTPDVYVQPLDGGAPQLASIADQPIDGILGADISDDGRRVGWGSYQTGREQVWVRDLATGTTTLVADSADLMESVRMSGDGTHVVFKGDASTLVPGDTNNMSDIFVADLTTGALTRANITQGGQQQTRARVGEIPGVAGAALSDDGQIIAFWTYGGGTLTPGDAGHVGGVFVRDLTTQAADRPQLLSVLGHGSSISLSWRAPVTPTGTVSRYRASPLTGANVLQPFDVSSAARFVTHTGHPTSTVYRVWVQALVPRGLSPTSATAYVPVVGAPATVRAGSVVSLTVVAGPGTTGAQAQLWRRLRGATSWQYVQGRLLGADGRVVLQGHAAAAVDWDVRIVRSGAPTGARRVTTYVSR